MQLKFKCRASAAGLIMTNPVGKSPYQKWSDKVEQIKEASRKYSEMKPELKTAIALKIKISEYEAELPKLELHKNDLHLSETCLSYVEKWAKEQLYGRRKEFTSKYTDKGNLCEDDAIQQCAEYYRWGMVSKNTQCFEDEHFTGTPDILLQKSVDDTKVSWDFDTFPLFDEVPNKNYEWQGHIYKALTGREMFGLHYNLMDAPESIVLAEAWRQVRKKGLDELEADLYDEVKEHMTYSHLPISLRLKSWFFERNKIAEDLAREQVEKINKYINTLNLEQYGN